MLMFTCMVNEQGDNNFTLYAQLSIPNDADVGRGSRHRFGFPSH